MPIIQVKVKPNARERAFTRAADGTYLAEVKAPPQDGKANAELVRLVARHFGCPVASVQIKLGGAGRYKLLRVPDA